MNNYNARTGIWDPAIGAVLADDDKRTQLEEQLLRFFTTLPVYRGLSLDFENLDDSSRPAYLRFIQELYGDTHERNLRLYVNVRASADADTPSRIAADS